MRESWIFTTKCPQPFTSHAQENVPSGWKSGCWSPSDGTGPISRTAPFAVLVVGGATVFPVCARPTELSANVTIARINRLSGRLLFFSSQLFLLFLLTETFMVTSFGHWLGRWPELGLS